MKCIGVIFAGGVGSRMHSKDRPKQFLEVFGQPIMIHTLKHFERNEQITDIVIASVKEWIPYLEQLIEQYGIKKVRSIVSGGETGQLSIYNGLEAAEKVADSEKAIVLIHDGVRPLISSDLLDQNIECVKKNGSCITAGIVKETIVVIDDSMQIQEVPPRVYSRVAKAPQSFWLDEILSVQRDAISKGMTTAIDSCTLMQSYGKKLYMIDGPYDNIKITTPDDFFMMRAILETKENEQIYVNE